MTEPGGVGVGTPGTLDEAWAEAEAALPPKFKLRLLSNGRGTYHAEMIPPGMSYEEWHELRREGFGDTPSEALQAVVKAAWAQT